MFSKQTRDWGAMGPKVAPGAGAGVGRVILVDTLFRKKS